MKKLLLIAALLLAPLHASAGTLIITAGGFSNLPATPPAGWPANVTWPGGASPNGSKTYTISDAAWIQVLTWTATSQASIQGTAAVPSTPTAGQILLAWLQVWVNGTIIAVQQLFTQPAVPPAPIVIQ